MADFYVTQNSQSMLWSLLNSSSDYSTVHLQKNIDILDDWVPINRGKLTVNGHGFSIGTEDWRLTSALFGPAVNSTATLSELNFIDLTVWVSINDTNVSSSSYAHYMGAFVRYAANCNATNCITCGYIKFYRNYVGGIF